MPCSASRVVKVSVVGSGPAGFYTAQKLLRCLKHCQIDMFEALPVPFGLARYGVAPDHPEVKNVVHKFSEVALDRRVRFYGNVRIGTDIPLVKLHEHYDATVYCYGSAAARTLSVPGIDLKGVLDAREMVAWYNGHPEVQNLGINLEQVEQAVVIGHGNVALDLARVLLSDVDKLRKTDISERALEELSRSRVKSVKIIGRRGPLQASFTAKEIRELIKLEEARFINSDRELHVQASMQELRRPARRLMQLLAATQPAGQRSWDLLYKRSPRAFIGDTALEKVQLTLNELQDIGGRTVAQPTNQTEIVSAEMALVSIGYRAIPLPGMSEMNIVFDTTRHILPNVQGRVNSLDASVPGTYCSGWVKNGPVGVIASTMQDAFETAEALVADVKNGMIACGPEKSGRQVIESLLAHHRVVTWQHWLQLARYEASRGAEQSRPACKVLQVEDMLRFAGV